MRAAALHLSQVDDGRPQYWVVKHISFYSLAERLCYGPDRQSEDLEEKGCHTLRALAEQLLCSTFTMRTRTGLPQQQTTRCVQAMASLIDCLRIIISAIPTFLLASLYASVILHRERGPECRQNSSMPQKYSRLTGYQEASTGSSGYAESVQYQRLQLRRHIRCARTLLKLSEALANEVAVATKSTEAAIKSTPAPPNPDSVANLRTTATSMTSEPLCDLPWTKC